MPRCSRVRLSAIGVSHTYPGRPPTVALQDALLHVHDNEFVAIVGPVGCGKTTFLRIAAGLLRPSKGLVTCDGRPVSGPGPERGIVFQEEALFPWLTVRENLELGLLAKGLEAPTRRAIVEEWLGVTKLEKYARAYPKELSGGMAKMVEVARVLATDPAILLLDEPFGLLDAQTRLRMQAELSRLWEYRHKTVVLVTHDVEEALLLADRVVVFTPRPGRVKAEIEVPLARPRSWELRFAPELSDLKRRIWERLDSTSSTPAPEGAPGEAREPVR